MNLDEFGECVWSNWKNGEGPCEGCPNRDADGQYTPKNIDPGSTSGVADPVIVYVADCPGDGNNRSEKNSENTEPVSSTLHEEIEKHWYPVMKMLEDERIPGWFFEEVGYIPEKEGEAYYTNAKKCADIEGDDEKNKNSRENCEIYLEKQLQLLDPDVIVGFGNKALDSLESIYGFNREDSITGEALSIVYQQEPIIIPSLHWGRIWLNLRHLSDEPDEDEYWRRLIKLIDETFPKEANTGHT